MPGKDGKLGQPFYVQHYPGMGFKTSADGPGAHTHGVIFSKDDKYVFVAELGIERWHISISHIETHATASAIGISD